MKSLLLFVFLFVFATSTFAQTDIFRSSIKATDSDDMYSIRRDAAYTDDLAIYNYEHLFPLGMTVALGTKIGVLLADNYMLVTEASFVAPGPRHFAEAGIGALINTGSVNTLQIFNTSIISGLEKDFYFTLRLGYRYQLPEDFFLKPEPCIRRANLLSR